LLPLLAAARCLAAMLLAGSMLLNPGFWKALA
jgi:hypothetical protein